MIVVGLDASPRGWACVALRNGRFAEAAELADVAAVLARWPRAVVVGVDIPIGLPEHGIREADRLARAFVGARRASVWSTPTRSVLESEWSPGLGVSLQAHGMRNRIFEIEKAADGRVTEVHPEVTFAHLSGQAPLAPKRTWRGIQERLRLLEHQGVQLPHDLPLEVPPDDLLDAAAVAWSAGRVARGRHRTLPPDPRPGEPVISY